MINILLGSSGSGKSYEACVFHILAALKQGRMVITNLPINVDAYEAIEPGASALIDYRKQSKGPRVVISPAKDGKPAEERDAHAFEHISDYGCTHRNAKGQGALYVIDEAHKPLRRGATSRVVEEWFAEHRHENADALLITQSYGKLSADVLGNVQLVYRVRKAVAFGSMTKYIRKVQDGLRGEVVNTSVREYEPKYFRLYTSHTKGIAAEELNASDVRPFWKHWSFAGAALCGVIVLAMVGTGQVKVNPLKVGMKEGAAASLKPTTQPAVQHAAAPSARTSAPVAAASLEEPASSPKEAAAKEPYSSKSLHLAGVIRMQGRELWTFAVGQNGVVVGYITGDDLAGAGYEWKPAHDCAGTLTWHQLKRVVLCDTPAMSITTPSLKS